MSFMVLLCFAALRVAGVACMTAALALALALALEIRDTSIKAAMKYPRPDCTRRRRMSVLRWDIAMTVFRNREVIASSVLHRRNDPFERAD